jgi:hypothetical protein
MDIRKQQADLDELRAETSRVFAATQRTNRAQRWMTPLVTASAWLALGTGFAAVVTQFSKVFLR